MATRDGDKLSLQRVSKGGFWNSPQPKYSEETEAALAIVMKEAKLTLSQQKQLKYSLQDEACSSSATKSKSSFKGKNPFVCHGSKKNPTFKSLNSGIRTKEKILNSGCYEIDRLPTSTTFSDPEREKEKLQNIMAYGEDIKINEKNLKLKKSGKKLIPLTTHESFQQILSEIEERKQFLEEMKRLGVAKEYSDVINNQIAQKLYELELLDRDANSIQDEIKQNT